MPLKPGSSLLSVIFFHRLRYRFFILGGSFLSAFFGILAPYFQKEFVDTLTGHGNSPLHFLNLTPLHFIFLAFACYLISQAFIQWTNYIGSSEALIVQRILSDRLYQKTLSLKVDTLSSKPLGELVQLYAADIPGSTVFLDQTLPFGASTLFPLLIAPLALVMMFHMPLAPTLICLFLVSFINTSLAFRQARFFYRFKQLAGERIALVNEWVQNIRALRVLGWMELFENFIRRVRVVETTNRVKMVTNGQVMNSISSSFTFILTIVTLSVLLFQTHQQLTPGEILAVLWILGIFLTRPFRQMPWFFTFAFDAWTSVQRLESFFKLLNSETPHSSSSGNLTPSRESALSVKNLNLEIQGKKLLKNINLEINKGEFVAIVGEVGSGKSLLLFSLMGETGASWENYKIFSQSFSKENKEWKKNFGFVPQEGFIISSTLRDNVLFDYDQSHSQDEKVYRSLAQCEFHFDQERFVDRLETLIGERGVNLSGGQKQRISLARTHFQSPEILLLDDCFSALDVDTEKKLLENLIAREWASKTKVLVTHRLSVLEKADRVLFIQNGQITYEGHYFDLIERSADFKEFTQSIHQEDTREFHVQH